MSHRGGWRNKTQKVEGTHLPQPEREEGNSGVHHEGTSPPYGGTKTSALEHLCSSVRYAV